VDLSIIIVNWNSKDYLRKCIDSILTNTRGIEYEIIVIDSASFDGCGEMLRQFYPLVRFIQSELNLGFARANNEAFKTSCGRNVLFLNPDTEVRPDAISELSWHLDSLPKACIAGAKLLNTDGTVQTSCIRSFPSILNEVLDAEPLRKLFPLSRLWGMAPLFAISDTPNKVDTVSGACLMIKREPFQDLGMFSTDYFMYSEDIDLCFKVWKAGWDAHFIPKSIVVHHGGASSSQSKVNTFSDVMMLESRRRFFRKTRNSWYSMLFQFGMLLVSFIRVAVLVLVWPAQHMRGKADGLEAALKKWKARLRWAIGFEKWVRSY
jgi:N-acetylglucosaminyl-diphospho-decaprenol L-rhamnosyltransferase